MNRRRSATIEPVRIIAANNHDLRNAIGAGQFREDLFYRLNVFPIEVPRFADARKTSPYSRYRFSRGRGPSVQSHCSMLTEKQLCQMQDYDWPGNVRELQNVIERAVITARRARFISISDQLLKGSVRYSAKLIGEWRSNIHRRGDALAGAGQYPRPEMSHGKVYGSGDAAELLGIKPTTLNARIKKWGLARR